MQDMNDKVFGGGSPDGELTAAEWNQPASELQNIIEGMGITLSGADVFQVFKALAGFVAAGDFYEDSGAADAYVLSVFGSRQGIQAHDANHDGAMIRFRPTNTNTGGACTVAVNGLAAESVTREDGSALQAGDIDTDRDALIRWDNTAGDYLLMDFSLATSSTPNVGRGYIDGFRLSIDPVDTDHDLEIASGICRDDGDTRTLQLTSAITKQIDANWALGDDAGGFPSLLTLSADTWYHVFIIRRTSDGLLDAGFDERLDAANLLTDAVGFSEFRRVGSIRTNGSSNITDFFQRGDRFLWLDPPRDVNVTNLSTSAQTYELSVPGGVRVVAHINGIVTQASDNARSVYVSSLDVDDEAPSNSTAPLQTFHKSSPEIHPHRTEVETDGNATLGQGGQIRARSSGSSTTLRIVTLGWDDRRGRN